MQSACTSWCKLKVKLGVNTGKPAASNTEGKSHFLDDIPQTNTHKDSTNNPAPVEAETPKTKKRKRAASPSGDSPVSAKNRPKKATKSTRAKEPEEAQIKKEASPQAPSEGSGSPPSGMTDPKKPGFVF